jgi:hypothetical protein
MGPRLVGRGRISLVVTAEIPQRCFNGAAAGWPRNGKDGAAEMTTNPRASMGPRLVGRGRDAELPQRGRIMTALQWGRGWLAAEGFT